MKSILSFLLILPCFSLPSPAPQDASTVPATDDSNRSQPLKDRHGNIVGQLTNIRRIPDAELLGGKNIEAMTEIPYEADQHFEVESVTNYKFPACTLSYRENEFQLLGPGPFPGSPILWRLVWQVATALKEFYGPTSSRYRPYWRRGYTFDVTDLTGTIVAHGYNGLRKDDPPQPGVQACPPMTNDPVLDLDTNDLTLGIEDPHLIQ